MSLPRRCHGVLFAVGDESVDGRDGCAARHARILDHRVSERKPASASILYTVTPKLRQRIIQQPRPAKAVSNQSLESLSLTVTQLHQTITARPLVEERIFLHGRRHFRVLLHACKRCLPHNFVHLSLGERPWNTDEVRNAVNLES